MCRHFISFPGESDCGHGSSTFFMYAEPAFFSRGGTDFDMDFVKNSCECCGTCCMNGGPALHTDDLKLFESGQLEIGNLITIRRGEMVYLPMSVKPHQADNEFIKLQGHGGEWSCMFFDRLTSSCTIYHKRPVACRLLKCWDPVDILNIAGKELLNRFKLLQDNNPLYTVILQHEKTCPVPPLKDISAQLNSAGDVEENLRKLEELVISDLRFRTLAVREHGLSVSEELFYFGRPIFQLLMPFGISVKETDAGLSLHCSTL